MSNSDDILLPIQGSKRQYASTWQTTNYNWAGIIEEESFEELRSGLTVVQKVKHPRRQQVRDRSKYDANGRLWDS